MTENLERVKKRRKLRGTTEKSVVFFCAEAEHAGLAESQKGPNELKYCQLVPNIRC